MALDLIIPQWPAPHNVRAFSTTRTGGLSLAPYDSLNVGAHVGDDLSIVEGNRALLPKHQHIKWLNQVHGNACFSINASSEQNQSVDASTTLDTGVVCAVMTADCLPILLCNKKGNEVAAVHAGWKGLADGVIENCCHHMNSSTSDLMAWIGPHISQKNFEVNETVLNRFLQYGHCFTQGNVAGKYQADLQQIAIEKLSQLGVCGVFTANKCTYEHEEQFFSHRRATHQGLSQTGRMVSGIYLQP